MKRLLSLGLTLLCFYTSPWASAQDSTALDVARVKTLKIERNLTEEGRACTPAISRPRQDR